MDNRSWFQRWADTHIGMPLYYCSECLLPAKVTDDGKNVRIHKSCDCVALVNAPRKVYLHGAHDKLSLIDKAKIKWSQVASRVTGRCV